MLLFTTRRSLRLFPLRLNLKFLTTETNSSSHLEIPLGSCYSRRKNEILSQRNILPGFLFHTQKRTKYTKTSGGDDQDSDSDDDSYEEFKDERDSKVVKASLNSLRADLIIKTGLGMARNKVENVFYDVKIRVNGKKLNKKSVKLNVNDEIDVIKGVSPMNPDHLVVSRVIILAADPRAESLLVTMRRYKSLLIENYEGSDAWKASSSSDS